MNRKKLVNACIASVVIISFFVIIIVPLFLQTQFHYESYYPSGSSRHVDISLELYETSTNVSISFIDDLTLMYSIDVTQSASGMQHHFAVQEASWDVMLYYVNLSGYGESRVSNVEIVLGTGTYYNIYIDGYRTNSTILFSNNAQIRGQEIVVHCGGGYLDFAFTDDVNVTDLGLNVQTGGDTNLLLDIDLPDSMNGMIELPIAVDFAYTEIVGWSKTSSGNPTIYSTPSIEQPLLYIDPSAYGWVRARLHD